MTSRPRAFVIGHPIAHSRSPLIHGYWLRKYGLDGTYEAIDIAPTVLSGFVARLRDGEFVGGNVTIPHKQAIFSLCDSVADAALQIGAVNTLVGENGRIVGTNTDWSGFATNLDAQAPGWDKGRRKAIVLGAGGAARAVVLALIRRGFADIVVLNRTRDRAVGLVGEFATLAPDRLHAGALSEFAQFAPIADLVVNTTAIGMHGSRFADLNLYLLPDTALVNDIVYIPLETGLLAEARRLGLKTADGLGMLLHQAVPGFAAWFGVTPEVTQDLRQTIERSLEP